MKVGFTGTRAGMNEDQHDNLVTIMRLFEPTRATHGDCVGADKQFFDIANSLGIETESRPGKSKRFQSQSATSAFRAFTDSDLKHAPEPYHDRNRKIVDRCHILLACPARRNGRGGTWYTINYAIEIGRPVIIIHADGKLERHHESELSEIVKETSSD